MSADSSIYGYTFPKQFLDKFDQDFDFPEAIFNKDDLVTLKSYHTKLASGEKMTGEEFKKFIDFLGKVTKTARQALEPGITATANTSQEFAKSCCIIL